MYKTKNFSIKELVPKDIYDLRGEKSWELFRPEALITLDELRILFDAPVTINNWPWGGKFHYRGFRPITYYNGKFSLSQHILANAFDFDVKGLTADQARTKIIDWKKRGALRYLTGIELNISWIHIDFRMCERLNADGLFLFNP